MINTTYDIKQIIVLLIYVQQEFSNLTIFSK